MNQKLKWFLSRRRFLVNRDLQLKLLVRAVLAAGLMITILGLSLVFPIVEQLQELSPFPKAQVPAASLLLQIHEIFPPMAVLTILAVALCSLESSHRVAGPLYRLSHTFGRIRDGFLPEKIVTRRGDYLDPEVAEFNAMLGSLRRKAEAAAAAQTELTHALEAIRRDAGREKVSLEGAWDAVASRTARLESALNAWRREPVNEQRDAPRRLGSEVASAAGAGPAGGFSLLDMLILVSLTVTLVIAGGFFAPSYSRAVGNARSVMAIETLKSVSLDIDGYRKRHGVLPLALSTEHLDPWGNPYEYVVDEEGDADYRDYRLYSRGPDGKTGTYLDDPMSLDDVIRADQGLYFGLASDY